MHAQPTWFIRKWMRWLRLECRHHLFYFVCQFITLGALAYWWLTSKHLPPPGVAVAIIAVLAAILSFHGGIRPRHKLTYFVLMAALLITEFRSIRKDREEARNEQDRINRE